MQAKEKRKIGAKAVMAIILLIAIIAVAVTVGLAVKPKESSFSYNFGKSVACGIDVSEHNAQIDWKRVSSNIDFAFIRVAYRGYGSGNIVEDSLAKKNFKSANRAKIPVGAYFYSQAITEEEAREEAEFAIRCIRHYDVELPVVIDFEYAFDENGEHTGRLNDADNSREENARIINAFCDSVKKAGYTPGIYASSSVFEDRIDYKLLDKSAVIWVADYSSDVSRDIGYDIWQYSRTGECDGVDSSAVDLNYWYSKRQ